MPAPTVAVRPARRRDLPMMRHLQAKLAHAIGYMPPAGVDVALESGWIQTATYNDDEAGFILSRPQLKCSPTLRPIIQSAVHFDLQRRHVGLALLDAVAEQAIADGMEGITCWCAEELEANAFWKAAGFIHVGTRDPHNARNRKLNLWRLALKFPFQTTLVGRPSRAGFYAKRSAGVTLTPLAVALSQATNAERFRLMPAASMRFIDHPLHYDDGNNTRPQLEALRRAYLGTLRSGRRYDGEAA